MKPPDQRVLPKFSQSELVHAHISNERPIEPDSFGPVEKYHLLALAAGLTPDQTRLKLGRFGVRDKTVDDTERRCNEMRERVGAVTDAQLVYLGLYYGCVSLRPQPSLAIPEKRGILAVEVLCLGALGLTYAQMAGELDVRESTVVSRLETLYNDSNLQPPNQPRATAAGFESGLWRPARSPRKRSDRRAR